MTTSPMHRFRRRLARRIDPGPAPAGAARSHSDPSRSALVVGGGGSRASFELGALHYLYSQRRISPEMISGTSVGAIIAAVLAQYGDTESQAKAVERLTSIFTALQDSSEMFAEQPWFTALRGHLPTWRKAMALRQRQSNRISLTEGLSDLLSRPREAVVRITGERNGHRTGHAAREPAGPSETPTSAADRPGGTAVDTEPGATGTPPERAGRWTPANAMETLSTLWEVGRSSTDLEMIFRGAQTDRSAFTPGRIVEDLLDPEVFLPERLATSPVRLRITVVSLESGQLRYVDEHGYLRDREDNVLPGLEPVDLVDAVTASCAVPGVFPPVELAGEHYVDGGVRENVPAAVALDHTDVDECYVVAATPDRVPAESSYAEKDMMEILLRSTAIILSDELQRDEIAYARRRGAVVIQPELDIHDPVTIDPGLVSIAIDYGYLRAADVCEGAHEARLARTRDVIQLRRLIWTTEDEIFGPHSVHSGAGISEVAELKTRLRDLIADPGSAHLPEWADTWWRGFERHPFAIDAVPDWPGANP